MYGAAMPTRRSFLASLSGAALAAASATRTDAARMTGAAGPTTRGTFSLDDDRARFYCPAVRERVRLLVIADTHLFLDDDRGAPYREFSARMARAYNQTTHVRTGEPTTPAACFEAALDAARREGVDLVVLAGDIFSFPSEAAIEWATGRLQASGLPFVYTAGNHDWHYEGMPGAIEALREQWTSLRLRRLYQGRLPLCSALDVKGLRVVTIDNSCYGIEAEQLEFFRRQAVPGLPMLLLMHIPLYAPGRPVSFGCGHPDWGASTDRNAELERRPRWPQTGHTTDTLAFRRDVLATPNLLGVVAGHIHKPSVDIVDGVPQVVAAPNLAGGVLWVEVLPQPGA